MYYIDSATGGVDAFPFDAATGDLGKRLRLIDIPQRSGQHRETAPTAAPTLGRERLPRGSRGRRRTLSGTSGCFAAPAVEGQRRRACPGSERDSDALNGHVLLGGTSGRPIDGAADQIISAGSGPAL